MNTVKDHIELLAPVGSMESLYAAVQNGANAVYLGGKLFNARKYASNFDNEELKEAVKYAHLRGVKVYVTVNILIDDAEINSVIDYIKFLYEIDIDAVILQDLGLASLIRRIFPSMDIHGSTQMTVNNLWGVKYLEEMGFTRVVLARETPMEEIKHIKDNSSMELEVFIHGALCVSYSGQCLMSSLIGGRSGNRGSCAQPCRMAYSIVDKKGNLLKDWEDKHILSTKDLNTLDYIQQLKEIGVNSLKIEGRMKRPEYVATIVKNYRKVLDIGSHALSKKDKKDTEQIFNREFTKGLTFGDFGQSFISYDRPDNRGILLGKIENVDKYNVSILLEEDIEKGDGIEFILANGKYKGIKSPIDGKKGNLLVVEKPGYLLKESLVYKTSSNRLLKNAKASYEEENIKYPISMKMKIKIGENPILKIVHGDYIVDKIGNFIVEKGERTSLTREKIEKQLLKLGDTNYYLSKLDLDLEQGAFLPVSLLNQLRRDAIEELESKVKNFNHRVSVNEQDYTLLKNHLLDIKSEDDKTNNLLSIKISNIDQYNQLDINRLDRVYLGFYEELEPIVDELRSNNKEVYICTDKILYKDDLEKLDKIIKPLGNKIHGISVSNIGSLKYFKDKYDFKVHGDIGLNVFNSYTVEYLNSIGVHSLTLSPELTLEQIKSINQKVNGSLEVITYGYLPAMITKTCPMALVKGCKNDDDCLNCGFAHGYGLKDRKDMTFYMTRNGGFSTIYNSVPLMVIDSMKSILKSGVSISRLDFTLEDKSIKDTQYIYYDYINGFISEAKVKEFIAEFKENTNITKGHFYRGIM